MVGDSVGSDRRPCVHRTRLGRLRPQAWRARRRLACVFMEKFSMTGANVLEKAHNIEMNDASDGPPTFNLPTSLQHKAGVCV